MSDGSIKRNVTSGRDKNGLEFSDTGTLKFEINLKQLERAHKVVLKHIQDKNDVTLTQQASQISIFIPLISKAIASALKMKVKFYDVL